MLVRAWRDSKCQPQDATLPSTSWEERRLPPWPGYQKKQSGVSLNPPLPPGATYITCETQYKMQVQVLCAYCRQSLFLSSMITLLLVTVVFICVFMLTSQAGDPGRASADPGCPATLGLQVEALSHGGTTRKWPSWGSQTTPSPNVLTIPPHLSKHRLQDNTVKNMNIVTTKYHAPSSGSLESLSLLLHATCCSGTNHRQPASRSIYRYVGF